MRDFKNFKYILDQEKNLELLPKRYFNEMVNKVMMYKMNLDERLETINCIYEHALHIQKQPDFFSSLREYYKISDHVLSLKEIVQITGRYRK